MPLTTGQTLHHNRYRIVKPIGQGGFGAVYRAWDITLKQPIALKENLDTSQEAQRQFEREARLMAGLRHANLPRVLDHFFVPGQGQYLVMDFIEGSSLAELLSARSGNPFSEAEILPWLQQVCAALDYLHNRQPPIIHRDIKWDSTVRLWQVSDGMLLQTLKGHTAGVSSLDFSPDGMLLASASDDGIVRL